MTLIPNDKKDNKETCWNVYKESNEGRWQREDEMMEIRKNKREENLSKKHQDVRNQADDDGRKYRDQLRGLLLRVGSKDISVQFEAAWVLTNFAAGIPDERKEKKGVIEFVRFLSYPRDDYRELAVWALGYFAADSPNSRDFVLAHGALPGLLAQFNKKSTLSMLRNVTWALSNLCRGNQPPPDFEQIKSVRPILAQLINSDDE
ncbi:OLC1v1009041C1 [Oldenlandia corymbosa var. corymbosa]|uniref:OLC1v1009041C1 n=1 Tax=Oldenlandia corymbosa var. corymbosa TaxID=529605 RepID=A0AAV1DN98_OLDCO|nr:OLC1v1009041C1 [Oldenlandia corymbosa var. corymbosa]